MDDPFADLLGDMPAEEPAVEEAVEEVAEEAGAAAVEDAMPFEASKYKVQLAKVMVKRALLAAVK